MSNDAVPGLSCDNGKQSDKLELACQVSKEHHLD